MDYKGNKENLAAQDIRANLEAVQLRINQACQRAGRAPGEVILIGVTKTIDPESIATAFQLGIRHFGENRVQEAEKKIKALSHLNPRPIWHMIGHLQSNKVKTALGIFEIIQSVDSTQLAEAIDFRAQGQTGKLPVLLQVNVSGEVTKSGFDFNNFDTEFITVSRLPHIEIQGLMTIAPLVSDPEQVRPIFRKLREVKDKYHLRHLSMGMTDDFEVAIEEGATMVRIGRAIFGARA